MSKKLLKDLVEFIRDHHNSNGGSGDIPLNPKLNDINNFVICEDSNDHRMQDPETPLISALIKHGKFDLAKKLAVVERVNLGAVDNSNPPKTVLKYALERNDQETITVIQSQLNPVLLQFIKNYELGDEHDLENDLFNFGIEINNNQNFQLILTTGGKGADGVHALLNNNMIEVNDLRNVYNVVNINSGDLATVMRDYVAIVNHNDGDREIANVVINKYENDDAALRDWLTDNNSVSEDIDSTGDISPESSN